MAPSSFTTKLAPLLKRAYSSAASGTPQRKVAVIGASGGIGQPLGLLMKLNPLVSDLALYDVRGSLGVNADLSHVNTRANTRGYLGPDQLGDALKDSDVVIIPAGIPRKPGMTRQDLFNINAGIVKGIAEGISKHCPGALIAMISNPVNSTVPIAAEVLKNAGVFDPKKLFGVTTLDVVRAKTFYAHKMSLSVGDVDVPVVGGHAGKTILPLFSQATPLVELTPEEREYLTKRTQDGGTEVVEAKEGAGSATLSMAYAGAVFANSLLKGLNGEPVVECSYVASDITSVPYFSSKVTLGPNGVEEIHGLGPMNAYEESALKEALPELESSIKAGVDFVAK